ALPTAPGAAAGHVLAVEAGGQGGGVVGDHQVAGPQELDKRGTRSVDDLPARIDHEQLRPQRALDRAVGGDHEATPSYAGSAATMASASSRAATSGRFSVAGSASGTAAALGGVARVPGS